MIEMVIVVLIIGMFASMISLSWTPTFGMTQRASMPIPIFQTAHDRAQWGENTYYVVVDTINMIVKAQYITATIDEPVIDPLTGNPMLIDLRQDLDLQFRLGAGLSPPEDTVFFTADGMQDDSYAPSEYFFHVHPTQDASVIWGVHISTPNCRPVLEKHPKCCE